MSTKTRSPRLFSYVVHHDVGFAPCAAGRYCTLAVCKYSKSGRPNVVELAQPGDWIVGTGGSDKKSAGHGRMVYAMKVTEKLPLQQYVRDRRFRERADARFAAGDPIVPERWALVSTEFWYFGRNAPPIEGIEWRHLDHPLEKRGPGFCTNFRPEFVEEFAARLRYEFEKGIHGEPCAPASFESNSTPKCNPSRCRSKEDQPARIFKHR